MSDIPFSTKGIIEAALEMSGKSQYAFAKAAGLAPQTLWDYLREPKSPNEKPREMHFDKLVGLLKANSIILDVTLNRS